MSKITIINDEVEILVIQMDLILGAQVAVPKENAQVDVKITSEMATVALNVMYQSKSKPYKYYSI